jgi:hypothetical protein
MSRTFNLSEVEFTITPEPEDFSPYDGQFEREDGSNDDELCKRICLEAEQSPWAWACVKVSAKWAGFEGTTYLGAVSLLDGDEGSKDPETYFRDSYGYYPDMQDDAVADLKATILSYGWSFETAEGEPAVR